MDNSTPGMSELLIRYLDRELTPAEQTRVEEALASDPTLQQEWHDLQQARAALQDYGLQQKVAGIHTEMMKERIPVVKISEARKIIRYMISVAAGIVLVAGLFFGYTFYSLSSKKVFDANYITYSLSNTRGGDSNRNEIHKAYAEKKYDAVILLVRDHPESVTADDYLLAGMSYLEAKNYDRAKAMYNRVLATANDVQVMTRQTAEYYLALTCIANHDYDLALQELEKIKKDDNHLYHEKVSGRLIRQVKLLKWR